MGPQKLLLLRLRVNLGIMEMKMHDMNKKGLFILLFFPGKNNQLIDVKRMSSFFSVGKKDATFFFFLNCFPFAYRHIYLSIYLS